MKKIFNLLKKNIKLISFLSIILLIIFVNVSRVNADYMDEEFVGNRKERQFLEKVDAIKSVFPNQIDREALYATISHRGTFTDYVEQSYEPNFDSEEYKDTWSQLSEDINTLINNVGQSITTLADAVVSTGECLFDGTDENCMFSGEDGQNDSCIDCVLEKTIEKYADRLSDTGDSSLENNIKKPQAVDLLFAATIVMLDSSGWTGTYSDENYKQALAGEGLVGNMFDRNDAIQNFAAVAMNGVFCTVGTVVDMSLSWFNPGFSLSENGLGVEENAMAGKLSRYYTMSQICQYGYIGGTYEHVKNPDLSTERGKEAYQKKKDIVAEDIIKVAEIYRGNKDEECVYYGATGPYAEWKQTDPQWKDVRIGSSTVGRIGCTTTSVAIQIARSGTKITNLPSGYSTFNPGALASSNPYDGNNFAWGKITGIAPNVRFKDSQLLNSSDESVIASTVSDVLSTPVDGQYQPFVILKMYHNGSQHWVAVQGVENGKVVINDPARQGTSLSENYSSESWYVEKYKVMYATDVPFGSASSSGVAQGGSQDDSCVTETSGDIIIPDEYSAPGYFTVTVYNDFNWIYNQGKVYDKWAAAGSQWDDGIAVIDGRYLIACTSTFGDVGDKVDFFLDDGTKIPAIIADVKNPNDDGYNEWGHNNGQNVLEFEVSHIAYYNTYHQSNPGHNGWHMEWANKRVSSATNLGENIIN